MSIHTYLQGWVIGVSTAVAFGGSTLSVLEVARVERVADSERHGPFVWPGVFDLVGTGFPDGERRAVIHITRADTSYSLVSLQGPPGSLMRFQVTGDSARVVWNLGAGEVMVVDLRGSGDSLSGDWTSGDWTGPVTGVRRR